jgi:hypothetical protein
VRNGTGSCQQEGQRPSRVLRAAKTHIVIAHLPWVTGRDNVIEVVEGGGSWEGKRCKRPAISLIIYRSFRGPCIPQVENPDMIGPAPFFFAMFTSYIFASSLITILRDPASSFPPPRRSPHPTVILTSLLYGYHGKHDGPDVPAEAEVDTG